MLLGTEIPDAMDGVVYATSPEGVIISVGTRNWRDFAQANDGEKLAEPSNLIGQNLFGFIEGDKVVDIYRGYYDALLTGRAEQIRFPYRCDSPSVKREMRMAITPVYAGGRIGAILFQSQPINILTRPPLNILDHGAMRDALSELNGLPIVTLCSFCHDVKASQAAGGGWVSPEAYYGAGGDSRVRVSHGLCPKCHERWSSGDLNARPPK